MLRNPNTSITDGYDIHVVFSQNDEERATTLFEHFVGFIESKSIQYLRAKIYGKNRKLISWKTVEFKLKNTTKDPSSQRHNEENNCPQ